jgi:hypothetical protein
VFTQNRRGASGQRNERNEGERDAHLLCKKIESEDASSRPERRPDHTPYGREARKEYRIDDQCRDKHPLGGLRKTHL